MQISRSTAANSIMTHKGGQMPRRFVLGLIVATLAIPLTAACGSDNTEGKGNEFQIKATVISTTDHSVFVEDIVLEPNAVFGRARTWFNDGKHREIYDRYDNGTDDIVAGGVYKPSDPRPYPSSILKRGQVITIYGRIRDDFSDSWSSSPRAVYDRIEPPPS
jgi:hypothetical protein